MSARIRLPLVEITGANGRRIDDGLLRTDYACAVWDASRSARKAAAAEETRRTTRTLEHA
jgi:hypothetical protein